MAKARKPKPKPKKKRSVSESVSRAAEAMVNEAYAPAVRTGRQNVWDAQAQTGVIDKAVDRGVGQVRGAQDAVAGFHQQVTEPATRGNTDLAQGFVGAQAAAGAQQMGADAALLGRSAQAAEIPMKFGAAAQGALGAIGGQQQRLQGELASAHMARGANQVTALELSRGERQQANQIEIGNRRSDLANTRSERGAKSTEMAASMMSDVEKNQLAREAYNLDVEKFKAQTKLAYDELAEKAKARQADDALAADEFGLRKRDTDGDGVIDVEDPAPNTKGDVRPGQYAPKTAAGEKPEGAKEYNGGYFDKPSGKRTQKHKVGPAGTTIYVTRSEYGNAIKARREVLGWYRKVNGALRRDKAATFDEVKKLSKISDDMKVSIALAIKARKKLTPDQREWVRTKFETGHFPADLAKAFERGDYGWLKKAL